MSYAIGTKVTVEAKFRNAAGALFDPSTVRCHHKTPSGTETTYTYPADSQIVKVSTGIYTFIVLGYNTAAGIGDHLIRWDDNGEVAILDHVVMFKGSEFF